MNIRAAITSRVTLDSDRTIQSGQSITIFGIVIANSWHQPVEVDVQDGASAKFLTYTVPSKDTREVEIEFIADGGLILPALTNAAAGAAVTVTVFHSQGGS